MTAPQTKRPPRSEMLLSVVLPAYNEAAVLPQLVASLRSALASCLAPFELVFVNDGSRDATPETLDELAREDARIRVVHLSRNFGHQAAVHAGLVHARGDAVVLMDSDMQDDPAAIARFLGKWEEGCDVVYAIRTDRKEGRVKRCLFNAFHALLSRIAATPIPAEAGNFGLMDRRVVDQVLALGERDRYLPGLRAWVGFRQAGVPVERLARYDERPRVSLRGLWRLAKTAVFSFSHFPLTLFHAIGCTAGLIFLAVGGYALFCRLFTTLAIPGWTSSMLSACFFGAINALGISMLGEYVVRIYDQVRGRPLYLVARTVNAFRRPVLEAAPRDDEQLLHQVTDMLTAASSAAGQPSTAQVVCER